AEFCESGSMVLRRRAGHNEMENAAALRSGREGRAIRTSGPEAGRLKRFARDQAAQATCVGIRADEIDQAPARALIEVRGECGHRFADSIGDPPEKDVVPVRLGMMAG